MKTFIYNGIEFSGKRKFTYYEKTRGLLLPFKSIGISNYQKSIPSGKNDIKYSYKTFYKVANLAGCGGCDVFDMNGIEVIPCSNELFELESK